MSFSCYSIATINTKIYLHKIFVKDKKENENILYKEIVVKQFAF